MKRDTRDVEGGGKKEWGKSKEPENDEYFDTLEINKESVESRGKTKINYIIEPCEMRNEN